MSGRKETTIRINQSEYAELRRNAKRVAQLKNQNDRLKYMEELARGVNEELQRKQNETDAKIDANINFIRREFGDELAKYEIENKRNIDSIKKQYNQELKAISMQVQSNDEKLRKDMNDTFLVQEQKIKEYVDHGIEKVSFDIDNLRKGLTERLQQKKDLAEFWMKAWQNESDFIETNLRHELFSPGKLKKLNDSFQLVPGNFDNQMYEAVITKAQDNYLKGLVLKNEILLQEERWSKLYEVALEKGSELLFRTEKEKIVPIEISGINYDLDLEFWSEGKTGQIRDEVQKQIELLKSDKNPPDITKIEEILNNIHDLSSEFEGSIENATTALISSIQRADYQKQISSIIGEMGYRVVSSTYEGEDFRRGYYLKLSNLNNEEIVTVVEPGDNNFEHKFSINFYDESPNSSFRMERLNKIKEELAKEDINIGEIHSDEKYETTNGPEELRDLEKIKKYEHIKVR